MKNSFKIFDKIRVGAGITMFILFFGLSGLEAFRTHSWLNVVFWMVIAVMFMVADASKKDLRE